MRLVNLSNLIPMVLAGTIVACINHVNVQCGQDSDCNLNAGGVCTPAAGTTDKWCAFPDSNCPNGYRYSTLDVGDGVSGTCVVLSVDAGIPDAPASIHDWVNHYGEAGSELAQGVTVASNGDIVTTGRFSGTTNLGGAALISQGASDFWVARYRADGSPVWSKSFGGSGIDFATSVSVDVAGDVYLGGQFGASVDFGGGVRTASGTGGFILKLKGSDGSYVWDRTLGLSLSSHAGNMTISPLDANTIAVGGYFIGTVDFGKGALVSQSPDSSDSFVAAYDSSMGNLNWIKQISSTSNVGDFGGITVASGDVFATGGFYGSINLGGNMLNSAGSEDIFIVRYHGSDGAHVWSIRDGGPNAESPSGRVVVSGTRVVVGGYFATSTTIALKPLVSAGSLDGFVAGYNIFDGTPTWATQLGGTAIDKVIAATSNSDRIAIALSFSSSVTIAGQTLTADGVSASSDLAVVRLAPDTGSPVLVAQLAYGDAASLSYSGDSLVGLGSFLGSSTFFGTPLISQGLDDIVMFRVGF